MLRYRHAAALLVATFLVYPTLSSAQETDPIPGLPDLDIAVSVDVPGLDIDAVIAEAQEAIASGISEALVTTTAGISEGLDPDSDEGDAFSGISKVLHDTAMAIIRKIGGIAPDPDQFGDPIPDVDTFPF